MSRVIRGGAPPPRVVPGEVVDARAEAARVVAEAEAEAARTIETARREAARIAADARAEGLADGRAELARVLLDAARARDGAIAAAEREVQTLALVAAGRIVGETMALAPERITSIVREVLERARRARGIEIRVHPEDAATLGAREHDAATRAALDGVRVVEDPTISRGGCVVTSELGKIDARVEVQLAAMAELLGCERP